MTPVWLIVQPQSGTSQKFIPISWLLLSICYCVQGKLKAHARAPPPSAAVLSASVSKSLACSQEVQAAAAQADSISKGLVQLANQRDAEHTGLQALRQHWWQNTAKASLHVELLQHLQ